MKKSILILCILFPIALSAQNQVMTPELLWSLGRISVLGTSADSQQMIYAVKTYDLKTQKSSNAYYFLDLRTGQSTSTDLFDKKEFLQWDEHGLYAKEDGKLLKSTDKGKSWTTIAGNLKKADNIRISPDGKWMAFSKEVLMQKVLAKDIYPELDKSTGHIYTDLNYRHWDKWNDGKVSHVFVANLSDSGKSAKDILKNEPYDCPQKPFGGKEDFIFSPDSKSIIYVTKKKTGKAYAVSTNTHIYKYDIASASTVNLSKGMMGYDVSPKFSSDGRKLSWLSMKTDGFEADKNDLIILDLASGKKTNLTAGWDETIDGNYIWSNDGKSVFFSASVKGTQQLFQVPVSGKDPVKQMTSGNFNVTDLWAQQGNAIIAGRTDFNHATEIFSISLPKGRMASLTHVNDSIYNKISAGKSELRMVTTKDGHQMGVWVIYPPDFDPSKKYPALLYCQGGPQGALSQFYSFRWNFQLMAANGYIIVAPNRRGMPGWGVAWNASISQDWGGKPMQDYLDAMDALTNEPYVDRDRLGCVGASYGGYSVFQLAGMHNNRFKTFIAHDGLFDLKSWYGTTEELWFANWELGGSYWQKPKPESYIKFDPSKSVSKWNTPIMIIQGGKDYRVPIEQGLEAFQAAQLLGLKSKLLYFPDENHWVLHPHNALVWQHEFFKWLKETIE